MNIERTETELLIRIPLSSDVERNQNLIDGLRYLELTSASKATQDDVDALATSVNSEWLKKNKDRILK